MPTFKQTLFALWQYPLPHHALSRIMGRVTHCKAPWLKNALIRVFAHWFKIDLEEAASANPGDYVCFNDFFTRPLKPGARPLPDDPDLVLSPADGTISQVGSLTSQWLIQAKGKDYSAAALLGGTEWSRPFEDGEFMTIYLSPRDYHRVHMPMSGRLIRMLHVPERLFSVNPATTAAVDNLFARNERVVCLFDTEAGPMAMVLVGALLVASVETVWQGVVTPPTRRTIRQWSYEECPISLQRGEEMGRFNMGSTVIVLFPHESLEWTATGGKPLRMGEPIGRLGISDT